MPLYDVQPKIITSLSDRGLATGYPEGFKIITKGAGFSIESTVLGGEWYSTGSSDSIADRPSAALFGKGTWQVGNIIEISNGYGYISNKPIRKTPLKLALFGDSTANTGTYTSNDNCEIIDLAFPSSGTTSSSVVSAYYMAHMEYPVAMLARNCAIGGQTTIDMLARDTLVASATRKAATDIGNAGIDCVILRGGSINNFVEQIYDQSMVDDRVALHISLLSRLITTGAAILDEGIAGYGITLGSATAQSKRWAIMQFNVAIKAHIDTLNNPLVRFMNPVGITCDPTGIFLPGYSADGTHPLIVAQIAIAKQQARILTEMFGPSAKIQFPGTNLFANPMLATTTNDVTRGDTADGITIPADWSAARYRNLKVETIDGIPMQTVEATHLNGTVVAFKASITVDLVAMSIVSGDVFGMEFDYFVHKLDGTDLPIGATISAQFNVQKVGNGKISNTAMNYVSVAGMSEAKGHVSFNKIKINDSSANLELPEFSFVYSPLAADSIPANAVKYGIGNIRIVKQ